MLDSEFTPKVTSAAQIAADKVLGEVSEHSYKKYLKLIFIRKSLYRFSSYFIWCVA